ncbi:uncharacterized protein LOC116195350 [Punica granatum]|uniref:Uncharacterized protein LOC116195350 n=1 Tax=Punica granatum TaxID=22663 RepID=A0A6P8CD48_PUNGR|nr:uncharacterized protein LOC116195350 [Punica granatum]
MEGYFKGLKGLRQGDTLSPYLFIVAIEVLSNLLDKAAEEGHILYLPSCRKVKLTHSGFSDGLMIFLNSDVNSLKALLDIFYNFYMMYGLKLNPAKTEVFCAGMDEDSVKEMLSLSGFKRASAAAALNVPWMSRICRRGRRLEFATTCV